MPIKLRHSETCAELDSVYWSLRKFEVQHLPFNKTASSLINKEILSISSSSLQKSQNEVREVALFKILYFYFTKISAVGIDFWCWGQEF